LTPLLLVHTGSQVWIVYAVALWESAVAQLFAPAEAALVPALVPDTDLVAANALNVQNRDIARLVGAALGGIVATWGGMAAIAVTDAATFVTAAVLLTSIRSQVVRVTHARRKLTAQIRAVRTEWADGLRIATGAPILRTVLWCVLIAGVGEGAFGTLIAPWFHDVLHRDGTAYGLILSVQAVGGIAGGLATAAIGHRYPAHVLLGWGLVTFGAIDFTLFAYPLARAVVWPAVILIAIVGTPAAVSSAGLMTVVQRETLDASRGRVIGAVFAVSGAGMLLGVGIAASLPRWVGILPVLAVAVGVGPAAAGVLVLARTARQRRVVAVAVGQ
jgi:predicted MFS family arabinose efflux permease